MLNNKIISSIDIMLSDSILKFQYYGEFCQFINFIEDSFIPTCGVGVNIDGMYYLYNNKFLEKLNQEEVNFVMLHEIFHLLWDHQYRTRRLGYEHELSNVAQDMIINQVIKEDIIERIKKDNIKDKRNAYFAQIPKQDGEIFVLFIPIEYKGKLIYEDLYEWLYEKRKIYNLWKVKKDGPCPISDYLRKIFDQLDMNIDISLDKHLPSDIPEEYRKTIIENIKNYLKGRGLESDEIKTILNKLNKSKKDYLKNIKIGINELFGYHKEKSITKRNRRSIEGLKGKKHNVFALNVIIDVSGSMKGYLEKAISYVFQNDLFINLIQCDAKVTSFDIIKSKYEFKKLTIKGLGGTLLQPAIDYISSDKKLNCYNTLILTDGEFSERLNVEKLKKVLIISINRKVKASSNAKVIVVQD